MINEKRMTQFEAVYGELHDIIPAVIGSLRFKDADSYSLPAVASDYRLFCAVMDSVVVEVPDLVLCCEDFGAQFIKNIEAAGVRLKS